MTRHGLSTMLIPIITFFTRRSHRTGNNSEGRRSIGLLACCCSVLGALVAGDAMAGAEWVYSIDAATDELVVIDTETAGVAVVGPLDFDAEDVDLATIGNRLFALNRVIGVRVDVHEIDPCSGMTLSSAQVHTSGGNILFAEGLSAVDGQLKIGFNTSNEPTFLSNAIGDLGLDGFISNAETGAATFDTDGLGVDAGSGQLYGCDNLPVGAGSVIDFYTVDQSPLTQNTFLTVSPFINVNDVIVDNGILFGVNNATPTLHVIDLATNEVFSASLDRPGTYFGIALVNFPPIAVATIIADGEDVGDYIELPSQEFPGGDGALVTLDGSGSSDPDGDAIEGEWSVAEGSGIQIEDPTAAVTDAVFPAGVHQVTLTVYDLDETGVRKGTLDVTSVTVLVFDETHPLVHVSTDLAALWPANNKLVPVLIRVEADPEGLDVGCTISSNQPDDSDGTGELVGDVDGQDGFTAPVPVELEFFEEDGVFAAMVLLRAERDGADPMGRIYSINVWVRDADDIFGQSSTTVVVPHNVRRN